MLLRLFSELYVSYYYFILVSNYESTLLSLNFVDDNIEASYSSLLRRSRKHAWEADSNSSGYVLETSKSSEL